MVKTWIATFLYGAIFAVVSPAVAQSAISAVAEYEAATDAFYDGDTKRPITNEERATQAPDGFYVPLGICGDDQDCNREQRLMVIEMQFAYRGVYQAQRNMAFCLRDGCDANLFLNKVLGCAWRVVILASGNVLVDSSDIANHKICFSELTAVESATALAQASELFKVIYGREIGANWR